MVAVVVVFVVTSECGEGAEADGVAEENLRPGVYPHLCVRETRKVRLEVKFYSFPRAWQGHGAHQQSA